MISTKIVAPLLTIAFMFCVALYAWADVISGNVYGPGGELLKSATCNVFLDGSEVTTFTTDASGYYSVFLKPGRYKVRPKGNDALEGDLESYPQPVRQDIRLRQR